MKATGKWCSVSANVDSTSTILEPGVSPELKWRQTVSVILPFVVCFPLSQTNWGKIPQAGQGYKHTDSWENDVSWWVFQAGERKKTSLCFFFFFILLTVLLNSHVSFDVCLLLVLLPVLSLAQPYVDGSRKENLKKIYKQMIILNSIARGPIVSPLTLAEWQFCVNKLSG